MKFEPMAILPTLFDHKVAIDKASLIELRRLIGESKTYSDKNGHQVFHVIVREDEFTVQRVLRENMYHTYYSLPQNVNVLRTNIEAQVLAHSLSAMNIPFVVFALMNNFIDENIAVTRPNGSDNDQHLWTLKNTQVSHDYDAETGALVMSVNYTNLDDSMTYSVTHTYVAPGEVGVSSIKESIKVKL